VPLRPADEAATLDALAQRLTRLAHGGPVASPDRADQFVADVLAGLPEQLAAPITPLVRSGRPALQQAEALTRVLEHVHRFRLPGARWLAGLDRRLRTLAGHRGDLTDFPALDAARRALTAEALDLAGAGRPRVGLLEFHGWCIFEGFVPADERAFVALEELGYRAFLRPNLTEALTYTSKALHVANEPGSGVTPAQHARMLVNQAQIHASLGNPESALDYADEAVSILRSVDLDESPEMADLLGRLAGFHLENGDPGPAASYARQSADLFRRLTPDDPLAGYAERRRLVEALRLIPQDGEAVTEAEQLLSDTSAVLGPESTHTALAAVDLTAALADAGAHDRAERLALWWHEQERRRAGVYHSTTRWFAGFLAYGVPGPPDEP
jgi:tetratricopeptide (TPR) repeat protein